MNKQGKKKHWTHQQGIAHRLAVAYGGKVDVCWVVFKGRTPGIYRSMDKVNEQVRGFEGAKWKGFPSQEDAEKALMDYFWK